MGVGPPKAQISGGNAAVFCNALRTTRSTFAQPLLAISRRSGDSDPQPSEFVINLAFIIRISSFSLLCDHCLAQIPQLFIHVALIDNCAADFFPQNRTIARTQTCHVNAQMSGRASESVC